MSAAGAGLRTEGGPDSKKRALAAVLVLLAVIAVAILLFRGDGGYRVTAEFVNAGQLVKGNEVKAGGVAVGSVKDIDVTQDGTAKVTLAITDSDYEPLRCPASPTATWTSSSDPRTATRSTAGA
jgi:ABC-type transporter Mla subunit MlaD